MFNYLTLFYLHKIKYPKYKTIPAISCAVVMGFARTASINLLSSASVVFNGLPEPDLRFTSPASMKRFFHKTTVASAIPNIFPISRIDLPSTQNATINARSFETVRCFLPPSSLNILEMTLSVLAFRFHSPLHHSLYHSPI